MAAAAALILPSGSLADGLDRCGGDAADPEPSTTTPDDESEASGTNAGSDGALGRLLAVFGSPPDREANGEAAAGSHTVAVASTDAGENGENASAGGGGESSRSIGDVGDVGDVADVGDIGEIGDVEGAASPQSLCGTCGSAEMERPKEDERDEPPLEGEAHARSGMRVEGPSLKVQEDATSARDKLDQLAGEGSPSTSAPLDHEPCLPGESTEGDRASEGPLPPRSDAEAGSEAQAAAASPTGAETTNQERGRHLLSLLRMGEQQRRTPPPAPPPPLPVLEHVAALFEAARRVEQDPPQTVEGPPNPAPDADALPKNCSGSELLRIVKGKIQEQRPRGEVDDPWCHSPEDYCSTSAGLFPMSLTADPWEPLVRPIVDESDPKAFVGAEVFCKKGGGISVVEGRAKPQVLVDQPDRGIMVMYKPSGWATCSTPHWEGNEGNLIRHVWRHLNAPTAAPCHRLDKGTSGIVVVAMNKVASKHICRQISQKKLVKQYIGLCHGHVAPAAGAMSAPLALSSTDKPLGTCCMEGREAVTRYRVLGYFGREPDQCYSLVQVQIDHGRQHQIRLHMSSFGHPLVSDPKYNSVSLRDDAEISPRLFLHACYLRCILPAGEDLPEEPFHVACRLPPDLKHALLSVLVWQRELDDQLMPEASRVCECLLAPENAPSSGDADSLHASRLVVRRRDDFLHRFGFNGQEKAEVTRILSTLPTAKERSAALQQFRVLGQRTPDFIVARFGKYVEGLLRWRKGLDGEEGDEEEDASGELSSSEAVENGRASDAAEDEGLRQGPVQADSVSTAGHSAGASAGVDPVRMVCGPVRIRAETIWCEVCGCEERLVSLNVPALSLRLRVPPQRYVNPCFFQEEACSSGDVGASLAGWGDDWGEDWAEDWAEDWGEAEGSRSAGQQRSRPARAPAREAAKAQKEHELQQVVREFVQESGGTVDGTWVSNKVASRFNQWVRTNNKRNDGSLRRWVGTIPGVTVEHCGKNKWRVHSV